MNTQPAIAVRINGKVRDLPEITTVAELLTLLQLPSRGLAVEVNQVIVPRHQHETWQLREGDTVEIVHLVGGG